MNEQEKRADPEWRTFERLVALIELEAGPRGARVVSPDRIRDIDTGQLREVDASIRFNAGSVEILVTVECRKRSRKADDTWIEQLATKRHKIGAARTIAVSSAGFTDSAQVSAKRYGIELRHLESIRSEDIDSWFLPHGIVHIFRDVEDIQCVVHLASGATESIEAMRPAFRHKLVNGLFPAAAFLNFIEMKEPKRFWAVPLDGTKTRLTFELDGRATDLIPVPLGVPLPDHGGLKVVLEHGVFKVARIELSLLFSYKAVPFTLADGDHHTYHAPGGSTIQHSSFAGEVFGLPVQFDHQANPDGTKSSSVQFPSGVRLPSQWSGMVKNKDDDA
ncbi:MAG: restriction endonuclease [Acidobacteria bacterium]|nr:restriction endonuclease [Acidobacteriota bacterium]